MTLNEKLPTVRRDLEFFPLQHAGQQFVLIRDHLGLVQDGKALSVPLYQLLALLERGGSLRDLQMALMRQTGGVLMGAEEVRHLLAHLDESFLLDSDRFRAAREKIVTDFALLKVRACAHCGQSYPANPSELKTRLTEIMAHTSSFSVKEGKVIAIVAPHIDISAGLQTYAAAYQQLSRARPSRVVLFGVGHRMPDEFFCVTEKDFATPLGIVPCEQSLVRTLREEGGDSVAANDFVHRSEHSIEFQLLFLQHLLPEGSFKIIPILCGSVQEGPGEYSRRAYLKKAGPFLRKLRDIVHDPAQETLVVAGVDFSHIGPKFGHDRPASFLAGQAETHDRNLLGHLSLLDAELFWRESQEVEDRFNVCGFSALACLLEVLPHCKGTILDYRRSQEEATNSAVSFAAVAFTA